MSAKKNTHPEYFGLFHNHGKLNGLFHLFLGYEKYYKLFLFILLSSDLGNGHKIYALFYFLETMTKEENNWQNNAHKQVKKTYWDSVTNSSHSPFMA